MRNLELLIFVAILASFSIGLPLGSPSLEERIRADKLEIVQALTEVIAGLHTNPVTIPAESRFSVPDWSNSLDPQYFPPQHYSWDPTSSAGQHESNLVFHPTELAPPQAVPHWAHPTTAQAAAHVDQLPSAQASTSHVEPSSRTSILIANRLTRIQKEIKIPRPLTQTEREGILMNVASNIETQVIPNLIYPFSGNSIGQGLLNEFTSSRYLRMIQPDSFVVQRGRDKNLNPEQITAGMEGVRASQYQMYVWNLVPVPGEASLNIFQLIGMIEAGVVSRNAVISMPKYLTGSGGAQALGSDSILVFNELISKGSPVEERRRDQSEVRQSQ
ncbi:hypothetical protein NDA11_005171 [Ustilago hordei]|uniref:Uncharacterized protein n=1 Tax=Ustilago hordei TaxID=120017 RepID=I2FXX3_USTHO|nr:uncharacterized protein UHO2_00239 [Ustilago hordei]KAJ1041238.1 hypothetical protein NDA10_004704 [Ustilago hordei]KAJ1570881.1 hypothetical protein NDA11_005171 [Ustilago hordei]KAJ1587523.1 hypothetical protein NDA15_006399 [Ustilago hordei]KAJ1589931.1 hypothetical protein NDA12_002246 [Ustilago hordei]CCF51766.1 uncharacterized protein UHOR_15110 [Ustilago hordei]